jgi:hypothetical protein
MKPMKHKSGGNGSGKVEIHQRDMGGFVRVWLDEKQEFTPQVPLYLSLSLTEWFRKHAQLQSLYVVPMTVDGNTVELHGWYRLAHFPDLSGQKAETV